MFTDRAEAGRKMAEKMLVHKWHNPLILALPRGGVVVARYIWESLGGELDLYITRKIGAPGQPELAVGAVAADGNMVLDHRLVDKLNISSDYIDKEAEKERAEIDRRMEVYRGGRPLPAYEGRQIVLVDDGVATGSTMIAAIEGLRENNPEALLAAVPVGPPDTIQRLSEEVDEIFYLEAPSNFGAVGQFYRFFGQVADAEVIDILKEAWGS